MLFPGQGLKAFDIYKPETRGTDNGRAGLVNQYTKLGSIDAVLAAAKPEEVQRWKQLNHPVSHKIIMQKNPPYEVKPGYVFKLTDTGQQFFVETLAYDPGGIGHWTIFYCTDRRDVRN
jgi:hypothetical protein